MWLFKKLQVLLLVVVRCAATGEGGAEVAGATEPAEATEAAITAGPSGAAGAAAAAAGWAGKTSRRYVFYRSMGPTHGWGAPPAGDTRRVFGGSPVQLSVFPGACVLLDRYWAMRCTATVVAPRWALTAAHCVSPHIAYVKYNTRQPSSPDGDLATVHYLYRHPNFKVVQEDEGRGVDVTVLHHDVGLVRTRGDMLVLAQLEVEPLRSLRLFNPVDIRDQEVQVLGFGRTEKQTRGEELFQVTLRLVYCERGTWFNCMCGISPNAERAASARGVCSGDSGGPVVYQGAQIGVTSMGPIECSSEHAPLPEGATSVFTSLYNYADLVNATISDTEAALRMRRIAGAPRTSLSPALVALAPLLTLR